MPFLAHLPLPPPPPSLSEEQLNGTDPGQPSGHHPHEMQASDLQQVFRSGHTRAAGPPLDSERLVLTPPFLTHHSASALTGEHMEGTGGGTRRRRPGRGCRGFGG